MSPMAHHPYTAAEISRITGGRLQGDGSRAVRQLLVDSRQLIYPDSTLFVALVSQRRDAHQFIPELYDKGVRAFLVSRSPAAEAFPGAAFIRVDDTLGALQDLAAWHRRQYDYPVVAITGSNGKTVVKEWLYQLLQPEHRIVRSPKSYNSQTGVPLSVWQMDETHTLGLFEAGISRPGEMERLARILRPDIGIFTNIGDAHAEGFRDRGQKIEEKLRLFAGAGLLIYCRDYTELHEHILRDQEAVPGRQRRLFTFSREADADLRIRSTRREGEETHIAARYHDQPLALRIPFTDAGSVEDALLCCCLLLWMGTPVRAIAEGMARLHAVAMRLELKKALNGCSLINDSYNADLGSLSIALDFLAQQQQHPRRTLVLSDLLESGRPDAELYGEVAGLLQEKQVNRLIGIGPHLSREKARFQAVPGLDTAFYPTTEAFLELLPGSRERPLFRDETILLKGARVFAFERIVHLLEQQAHRTVLEIDLGAMAHNLKAYQSLLAPSTRTMAMVKAFSYGSGSHEVAGLLQFHQVDYLAVAYTDEGSALRGSGITLPIMVMNPEADSFDALLRWELEPEIYALRQLQAFSAYLEAEGRTAYPVHLKLDTGMHRLGFQEQQLDELLALLRRSPLRLRSVFSHLAASEDPAQDAFTREQARRFDAMSGRLEEALGYPFLRHLANTSAITRFPELQYDMVRLGIGLYGIAHSGLMAGRLRTVSTLKTTVSQLRELPAGETVGYGRAGRVDSPRTIATVAIGYADGYMRCLGGGRGQMWLRGHLAPVIGQVCMDMVMLDVTGIPGVAEGDEVVVFGERPSLEELAAAAGTIPYELMTGVSQRVKRVYFQE